MKNQALWIIMLSGLLVAQTRQTTRSKSLVFTHITIIDATGAPAKADMAVVITGDRIRQLAKSGEIRVPRDAQVVDATGKFLIPGLWDMHVHTLRKGRPEMFFPLFLANGVTGVRDMGGDLLEQTRQLRKQISDGILPGLRIVTPGPVLDGPKQVSSFSIGVANEIEARQTVDSLKEQGVDFIKLYSLLPRDVYFAIANEATKQGLPFSGHVPYSVSAAEASDAGQTSIEHLSGVLLACSTAEAELRKALAEAMTRADATASLPKLVRTQTRQVLETFSDQKAAELLARFSRNHTWQCPTLVVLRAFAFLDASDLSDDARLKYIPFSMRERWNPKGHLRAENGTPEDLANSKKVFQKELEIVRAMRLAGLKFLAGTDAPTPNVFPGFGLHDELRLLVSAGLTPMEALQAATRNAATYLGLLDSLGTVEKGKIADLVLLEGNPLDDISNTQKIAAVVLGGKLISKFSLQSMLAEVERMANKK